MIDILPDYVGSSTPPLLIVGDGEVSTVMIHRELGSHHHLGGGEEDQPDGPATQLFLHPHPAPDSRIKDIKIKMGLENKKKEENETKFNCR